MRALMGFSSSMLCGNDDDVEFYRGCVCVCFVAWGAGHGFARQRWESIPRASQLISALCISKKSLWRHHWKTFWEISEVVRKQPRREKKIKQKMITERDIKHVKYEKILIKAVLSACLD